MSSAQKYAPFRIEIKDNNEGDDVPWTFYATASTAEQAEAMAARQGFDSIGLVTRIVPNDPLAGSAPIYEVPAETRLLIQQLTTENTALRIENNRVNVQAAAQAKAKAVAPVDALTGPTPPPFAVGQIIRDRYTGIAVKVIDHHTPHPLTKNPRAGLTWRSLTKQPGEQDYEGWLPSESMGCYRALRDGETASPAEEFETV